jgi:hypothetical protein
MYNGRDVDVTPSRKTVHRRPPVGGLFMGIRRLYFNLREGK